MTRPAHPTLLWFGVLAAPAAWVAQLVSGYAIQEAGCSRGPTDMAILDLDTEAWIGAISIAAILVAIAGAAAAIAGRRSTREDPGGRVSFMGDIGLLGSLIFLAVIVLGAVALPTLDACDTG